MHPIENEFLQVVGDDELLDVAVKRIIHTHIMLQPPTEEELRVVDAILCIAQALERYGQTLCNLGSEPHYHNRQHALEVMAAAVLLLNQESSFQLDEQWPKFNQLEKLLITLAALAHDFEHPGGVNVSPAQIESISARQVTDLIMPLGLNVENIDLIQRLILATEFEIVPALHQKVAELPTDSPIAFFYRASIILTEADILPSVLPHHGIALAQKLSLEWQSHGVQQRPNPSLKSVHQNFLNKVSFSSPHSKMLQIKELIRSQTLS